MPEPTTFIATITFRGFGTTVDEAAGRILRAITTHPTLSFVVDEVAVEIVTDKPEAPTPEAVR